LNPPEYSATENPPINKDMSFSFWGDLKLLPEPASIIIIFGI